ncbi:hypothetical protein HHI36_018208 [Cryptolaemus montrouzieri]|uniref:Uncharacterized protein n=1 Tax=Cryptolaemus montrouzieri TaxID=559131 RepID=A0ABD2NZA3_9CUCU
MEWYARIYRLGIHCNFQDRLIGILKNKFVTGLLTGQIFDRICEEKERKSLEDLKKIAAHKEGAKKREKKIHYNHRTSSSSSNRNRAQTQPPRNFQRTKEKSRWNAQLAQYPKMHQVRFPSTKSKQTSEWRCQIP